jgi:hypothetical protein
MVRIKGNERSGVGFLTDTVFLFANPGEKMYSCCGKTCLGEWK